jgi:hypothetical protein
MNSSIFVVADLFEEDERADEGHGFGGEVIFRGQDGHSGRTLLPFIDILHHDLLLDRQFLKVVLPFSPHSVPSDLLHDPFDILLGAEASES